MWEQFYFEAAAHVYCYHVPLMDVISLAAWA